MRGKSEILCKESVQSLPLVRRMRGKEKLKEKKKKKRGGKGVDERVRTRFDPNPAVILWWVAQGGAG